MYSIINRLFNRPKLTEHEGSDRVVIIHNHLFKNAGSTIDWALKKNFNSSFIDHRQDDLMRQGADYLGPYLAKKARIKALSTHHLVMPLPIIENTCLLMMTMFRHPIERVASVYNFERKQRCNSTPGVVHARKLSIGDYIQWRLNPQVGATIRNFQARRMLPPMKPNREIINCSEIEEIEQRVQRMSMLGLVDRFDESMVLFEDVLKEYFPRIDLSYIEQNIGQERGLALEDKLMKLEAEIGEDTYKVLIQKNQHDIKLYEFAMKEFQNRIDNLEGFIEKLENFRVRCGRHE